VRAGAVSSDVVEEPSSGGGLGALHKCLDHDTAGQSATAMTLPVRRDQQTCIACMVQRCSIAAASLAPRGRCVCLASTGHATLKYESESASTGALCRTRPPTRS